MEQDILVLKQAVQEITNLRNQNSIMGARLQMFDELMLLFRTAPTYPGQAMSPDVVYDIKKLIDYKESKQKAASSM